MACTYTSATLRAKALKAISRLIKTTPESILDDKIATVVCLRAVDSSVVTRESALDMLSQFFKGSNLQSEGALSRFTAMYLRLIVERASDKSHMVRRKVI